MSNEQFINNVHSLIKTYAEGMEEDFEHILNYGRYDFSNNFADEDSMVCARAMLVYLMEKAIKDSKPSQGSKWKSVFNRFKKTIHWV